MGRSKKGVTDKYYQLVRLTRHCGASLSLSLSLEVAVAN